MTTQPNAVDTTETAERMREMARRFAGLRSAQRTLARVVHPRELEDANRRGRQLLIRLQEVHRQLTGESETAPKPESLAPINALLNEVTDKTRALLCTLDIAQLRNALPHISDADPDEGARLAYLLIDADLENDNNLRMLEYLITMLSSGERGGRRVRLVEPSEVTPEIKAATANWTRGRVDDFSAARTLEQAIESLEDAEDLGAIRDRVRRFKEHLGVGILHPRVLRAVVDYNVAMSNQVAQLIEGGSVIDDLSIALLGSAPDEIPSAADKQLSRIWLLQSSHFQALVEAVRKRVEGSEPDDSPAARFAAACTLDHLRAFELQAFSEDADDISARLVTASIVVGLITRHAGDTGAVLNELGLEADVLSGPAAQELGDAVAAAARELFRTGRFDDAFQLSEVKTRHLGHLSGDSVVGESAEVAPTRLRVDSGLPPGIAAAVVLLLLLPAVAYFLWPSQNSGQSLSASELAELSPFVKSAYERTLGEHTEFVGRLNKAWDYLPVHQRKRVISELSNALRAQDVDSITLKDRWDRVHARYRRGQGTTLEPVATMAHTRPPAAPATPAATPAKP